MKRILRRRPGSGQTDGSEDLGAFGDEAGAGVPRRVRRRPGRAGRLLMLAAAGVLLMAGSIAGFAWTAAAFDQRVAVVVAAADLPRGHLLGAGDLRASLALPGGAPHLAWSDDTAAALAGLALSHPLPTGSLVTPQMLRVPAGAAFGNRLEVHVPIDARLAPGGVAEGDLILLIDPGEAPDAHGPGRARKVIEVLAVESLAGTALQMFAAPAEWVRWQTLTERLGGPPMAVPVPLGGDPDALAEELNALWASQHDQAGESGSLLGAGWLSAGRPGLLEAIVDIDASLSPGGLARGDTALLVDPGVPSAAASGGRPRQVLRSVRLDHYRDGLLGVWAEPAEWVWWQSLPQRLAAAPMLLRVEPGTDAGQVAAELNGAWRAEWEQRL